MYKQKIGIIGGFGAYATLGFYKRILEVFATGNERDYPHIIMDNDFTMPSRTRALLYEENYDEIVQQIAHSIRRMIDMDVEHIVLVCGTAHYFLEDVYKLVPEARERVIHLIDTLGNELERGEQVNTLVLAAEGALLKELYSQKLYAYGISCINPGREYYEEIRYFIESVKKNRLDKHVAERFAQFLDKFESKNVILGCTEFPILVQYAITTEMKEKLEQYSFFDPLEIAIQKLKAIMV